MGLNYRIYDKEKAKKQIASYLWERYLKNCNDYSFKARQLALVLPYSASYISRIVKEWVPCPVQLISYRSHTNVYKTQFEKAGVKNKIRKLVD